MERNTGMKWTKAAVAAALVMAAAALGKAGEAMWVQCKYCGHKAGSVASLTGSACQRHPAGPGKGRHALYEGSEKSQYTCKYCGHTAGSIASLTSSKCRRHPDGPGTGWHQPAL